MRRMKLRQLQYIVEVTDRQLNVTAAAEALFTSQPGVSKQIRLLEDELGVQIFTRNGKHLSAVTPAGEAILQIARRMLADEENIQRVAADHADESRGTLRIATTHTQARYTLPPTVKAFRARYPEVSLQIQQGTPMQIARWASRGEVDFAIATEAIALFDELIMLPCYHWNRCVLVPPDHPLTKVRPLTLEAIASHPIVTYVFGFTGRSQLDQAFAARKLQPDVVLTAVDADVIKTYVRLGLGVGIVASLAYDPVLDRDLVALEADALFERSTTRIGFRQGSVLRQYMYDFVSLFAPHLTRERVDELIAATPEQRLSHVEAMRTQLPTLGPAPWSHLGDMPA